MQNIIALVECTIDMALAPTIKPHSNLTRVGRSQMEP